MGVKFRITWCEFEAEHEGGPLGDILSFVCMFVLLQM